MTDDAYIARVEQVQSSRPSHGWSWRVLRQSPESLIAVMGLVLLDDAPYRSPHSEAGNIALCDGVPGVSCLAGGWYLDGQCLREESYLPPDVNARDGVCVHRRVGPLALTAQTSSEAAAPAVSPNYSPSERAVRDWLRRLIPAAISLGDPAVVRAATAYRSHGAKCSVSDTRALAAWCWELTLTIRPWEMCR